MSGTKKIDEWPFFHETGTIVSAIGGILRNTFRLLPTHALRALSRPAAIFFHGVEQRIDDHRVQTNHHNVNAFTEIANFLRGNFDVLPFGQIGEVIRRPDANRRAVFLMCDDGYANNLQAADILESLGLPWTLFVSTQHIDTGVRSPIFIARLFFLFAPDGAYDIPHLGLIALSNTDRESIADRQCAKLKALEATRADEAVNFMQAELPDLQRLLGRFRSDAFLSWDQVRELKKRGVEIGAHADRHWAMHHKQSPDYLREQAIRSKVRIEAEVGPCRAFAYPFGNTEDVCRDAWHAVRDAGFECGFTTLSGTLDAGANPYLLPRYGLRLRESRLPSVIPSLRLGNSRLAAWQRRIGG
jgi:peptidoglycan/xylan/chitin deacetylase (PgdA/CDA1 family)